MKKKHIIVLVLSFILLFATLQVTAAYNTSYSKEDWSPWGQTQYRYTIQADYNRHGRHRGAPMMPIAEILVKRSKWNDAMTHPTDISICGNKNLDYGFYAFNPDNHMIWMKTSSPRLNYEATLCFTMQATDIPNTFWIKTMNKLFSTAMMFGDEARIRTYLGEDSSSASLIRNFYPGA